MPDRLRIVVGGFLGLLPAGGITWDYVQYPAGFAALGHDVWYVEDTRLWPVYQDDDPAGASCHANVAHLAAVMPAFGLDGRWAYRDEASGECFGLPLARLREICRTADLFVNVSCSTAMRDDYAAIPARLLVDTDPMFTQVQAETAASFTAGGGGMRRLLAAHTHHFTFGESVGRPECRMPACGVTWIPTRQPVLLDRWTPEPPPTGAAFTTVMNWAAGKPLAWDGDTWGQKDVEFLRFLDLPARVPELRLALVATQTGGAPLPRARIEAAGWTLDPPARVADWTAYARYLSASAGECGVAKETYVKARTGWFSCRSACYLAAGRPVVTQDTGWSRHLPTGEGLFAFDTMDEAADALRQVAADPVHHARAARAIAAEHFDSHRVLGRLLAAAGA